VERTRPAEPSPALETACSRQVRFLQEGFDERIVGVDALDAAIADSRTPGPKELRSGSS